MLIFNRKIISRNAQAEVTTETASKVIATADPNDQAVGDPYYAA
jgi:hypothetical protein